MHELGVVFHIIDSLEEAYAHRLRNEGGNPAGNYLV